MYVYVCLHTHEPLDPPAPQLTHATPSKPQTHKITQVELTHRKGRVYTVNGLSPLPATQLRFMNEQVGAEQTVQVRGLDDWVIYMCVYVCVCMPGCRFVDEQVGVEQTVQVRGVCIYVYIYVGLCICLSARRTRDASHHNIKQPTKQPRQAYFQTVYGVKLQFPGLHCVRIGSKRKPTYFPIEVRM
jgi:hypothetical protein